MNVKNIWNIRKELTYRTSTVWTSPIVEGILPLKSFPSNNLSVRTSQKLRVGTISL